MHRSVRPTFYVNKYINNNVRLQQYLSTLLLEVALILAVQCHDVLQPY